MSRRREASSTLFPYTTLFRSVGDRAHGVEAAGVDVEVLTDGHPGGRADGDTHRGADRRLGVVRAGGGVCVGAGRARSAVGSVGAVGARGTGRARGSGRTRSTGCTGRAVRTSGP